MPDSDGVLLLAGGDDERLRRFRQGQGKGEERIGGKRELMLKVDGRFALNSQDVGGGLYSLGIADLQNGILVDRDDR